MIKVISDLQFKYQIIFKFRNEKKHCENTNLLTASNEIKWIVLINIDIYMYILIILIFEIN